MNKKNIKLSFNEIETLLNLENENKFFFISKSIGSVIELLIHEELKDNYDLNMSDISKTDLSKIDFTKNKLEIKRIVENIKIDFANHSISSLTLFSLNHSPNYKIDIEFELSKKRFDEEIVNVQKEALLLLENATDNNKIAITNMEIILKEVELEENENISIYIKDTFEIEPYINNDTAIMIIEKNYLFTDIINDFTKVLSEEETISKSKEEILPFDDSSTLVTYFNKKTKEMRG